MSRVETDLTINVRGRVYRATAQHEPRRLTVFGEVGRATRELSPSLSSSVALGVIAPKLLRDLIDSRARCHALDQPKSAQGRK